MLLNLHVKNLALIDEAEVDFSRGLNILTGETGAGKSIIIGSVNLALGAKVSKSMLRENAEYALVELTFLVEQPAIRQQLQELDIFLEDGEVIMSRKILASGRSVCRINSETVSMSMMRKVASLLIDIHGQHEHQSLLTRKNHLKYLDAYARKDLEEDLSALAACYRAYTDVKKELNEASMDAEQQKRELSFLQYELDEIEEAQLRLGEDEELEEAYRRFSNGRKIMEAVAECRQYCEDGQVSAVDLTGQASRALMAVSDYDENLKNLSEQLQEIESLLYDFNRDMNSYISGLEFDEEHFSQIQERLDQINHLKSKYGKTIEDILKQKEEKEQQLEKLIHYDEYRKKLEESVCIYEQKLEKLSRKVTDIRKTYAEKMTEEITKALQELNFLDVRFEMHFKRLDHFTANGVDDAGFLISTNPGEPLKPLDAVASGGELSRIMLALKTVLTEKDEIETLIFDEIDSGISGRTAQMVAEKIKLTGKSHQVICITHLPQIAAMADGHFLIEKTTDQISTVSRISRLNREESILELARMLGGVKITDKVLESAREMKDMADTVK